MKKIAIIIPYFGKFKNYFPLFLTSCKNNPDIDWIVFTDDTTVYPYPENVKVTQTSFDSIQKRIQEVFDFPICLPNPYKLCDFKPTYGEVFSTELKGYDFWGYGDCDLILGNIRKFLTDSIFDANPKVLTRGHLSFFRNDDSTNAWYRSLEKNFLASVFSSNRAYAFDEWGGVSRYWARQGKDYFYELLMDDIRAGYVKFRPTKEIHGYGSPYNEKNEDVSSLYKRMRNIVYSYENGSLFRVYHWEEKSKKKKYYMLISKNEILKSIRIAWINWFKKKNG